MNPEGNPSVIIVQGSYINNNVQQENQPQNEINKSEDDSYIKIFSYNTSNNYITLVDQKQNDFYQIQHNNNFQKESNGNQNENNKSIINQDDKIINSSNLSTKEEQENNQSGISNSVENNLQKGSQIHQQQQQQQQQQLQQQQQQQQQKQSGKDESVFEQLFTFNSQLNHHNDIESNINSQLLNCHNNVAQSNYQETGQMDQQQQTHIDNKVSNSGLSQQNSQGFIHNFNFCQQENQCSSDQQHAQQSQNCNAVVNNQITDQFNNNITENQNDGNNKHLNDEYQYNQNNSDIKQKEQSNQQQQKTHNSIINGQSQLNHQEPNLSSQSSPQKDEGFQQQQQYTSENEKMIGYSNNQQTDLLNSSISESIINGTNQNQLEQHKTKEMVSYIKNNEQSMKHNDSLKSSNISYDEVQYAELTESVQNLLSYKINTFSLPIKTTIYQKLIGSLSDDDKKECIRMIRCTNNVIIPTHISLEEYLSKGQFINTEDTFSYEKPPIDESHWYLNFADLHLFGFYTSSLYAQDELQCTEMPLLPHIKEYITKQTIDPNLKPLTYQQYNPTPILLMNIPRVGTIDINPDQLYPSGLYGNNFRNLKQEHLDRKLTIFQGDQLIYTNIIAMAALGYGQGVYRMEQIQFTLLTAYKAFKQAVNCTTRHYPNKKCVIHTGNWGCGAFGNNYQLMAILQIVAAKLAGVDIVYYHTFNHIGTRGFQEGKRKLETIIEKQDFFDNKLDVQKIVELIEKEKFRWGISDGN